MSKDITYLKGKRILFCFLILFLFVGCSRNTAPAERKSYDIDSAEKMDLPLSGMKYIPLETTDESLVGRIKKVIYHDHLFFIYDKSWESVFIFTDDGDFVQKIDRMGNGPGEYVQTMDIDVDENGYLYVSDVERRCIMVYWGEGYRNYKEIKIGHPFIEFIVENEHSIYLAGVALNGAINVNLAHFDVENETLNVLEETRYENEYQTLRSSPQSLFRTPSGLYYFDHLSHAVLSLQDGKATTHLEILSDRWPSEDVMESWQNKSPMEILTDRDHIRDLYAYYETDKHTLVQLTAIPQIVVLIDKESGRYTLVNRVTDKSFPIFVSACTSNKDAFLSTCLPTAENIEKIMKSPAIDDTLRKKLSELDEESNPILILYDLDYHGDM